MVVGVESLGSMANIMKELILFYTYMFMGRMKKFAHLNFLGNKNMPSLIDNVVCSFPEITIYTEMGYIQRHYQKF